MSRASYQDHRGLSFNRRKPVTKAQVIEKLDAAMDALRRYQMQHEPHAIPTPDRILIASAWEDMSKARRSIRIMVSK